MSAITLTLLGAPSMDSSIGALLCVYSRAMTVIKREAASANPDDARDVAAAQGGDHDAFARLVGRHQDTISRQMWRFTRDERQHEELVQDVFVNAFFALDGYRGDGPFLHWLRKIAVRTGYALWRVNKRHSAQSLDGVAERLSADVEDMDAAEAAEIVHRLLAQLPPRDRAVLTLTYLEGCNTAEVADLLGWSRTMVKVQCWRARGKLEKLLRRAGMHEEDV